MGLYEVDEDSVTVQKAIPLQQVGPVTFGDS